jgi:hypothetical protein
MSACGPTRLPEISRAFLSAGLADSDRAWSVLRVRPAGLVYVAREITPARPVDAPAAVELEHIFVAGLLFALVRLPCGQVAAPGLDIRLQTEGLANVTADLNAVRPEQEAA